MGRRRGLFGAESLNVVDSSHWLRRGKSHQSEDLMRCSKLYDSPSETIAVDSNDVELQPCLIRLSLEI